MFIQVTAINGHGKPVTIGIQYIVLIEAYDQPSEPHIQSIITLPNRVLSIGEPYDEVLRRIWAART